jgi:hypothetical protein
MINSATSCPANVPSAWLLLLPFLPKARPPCGYFQDYLFRERTLCVVGFVTSCTSDALAVSLEGVKRGKGGNALLGVEE